MNIVGPERRALDLRNAALRLRREVDYALGEMGPTLDSNPRAGREAVSASLMELTETLAVLRHVMVTIDRHTPSAHPDRARLAGLLEHFDNYHGVAR